MLVDALAGLKHTSTQKQNMGTRCFFSLRIAAKKHDDAPTTLCAAVSANARCVFMSVFVSSSSTNHIMPTKIQTAQSARPAAAHAAARSRLEMGEITLNPNAKAVAPHAASMSASVAPAPHSSRNINATALAQLTVHADNATFATSSSRRGIGTITMLASSPQRESVGVGLGSSRSSSVSVASVSQQPRAVSFDLQPVTVTHDPNDWTWLSGFAMYGVPAWIVAMVFVFAGGCNGTPESKGAAAGFVVVSFLVCAATVTRFRHMLWWRYLAVLSLTVAATISSCAVCAIKGGCRVAP